MRLARRSSALRYAVRVNGFTELVLTKLDVLSGSTRSPCARLPARGRDETPHFPAHQSDFHHAEPLFQWLPGWQRPIAGVTASRSCRPSRARVRRVSSSASLGVPVSLVGVGQRRDQILALPAPRARGSSVDSPARRGASWALDDRRRVKVLLVGSGGREHALASGLARSELCHELHAAPGNPGIAELATCHPVSTRRRRRARRAWRTTLGRGLVVIGPEAPLVAGLADALRHAGVAVFGPGGRRRGSRGRRRSPRT